METIIYNKGSDSLILDTRVNIIKKSDSDDIKYQLYSWDGDVIESVSNWCDSLSSKIFDMTNDSMFIKTHKTSAYQPMEVIINDIHIIYIHLDNSWVSEYMDSPLFERFYNILRVIRKIYNNIRLKTNKDNICVVLIGTNRHSFYRIKNKIAFKVKWAAFHQMIKKCGFYTIQSNKNNSGVLIMTKNKEIDIVVNRPSELKDFVPAITVRLKNKKLLFWDISDNILIDPLKFNNTIKYIFKYNNLFDYGIGDIGNFGAYKQIINKYLNEYKLNCILNKNTINYINYYNYASVLFKQIYLNKIIPINITEKIPDLLLKIEKKRNGSVCNTNTNVYT